MLICLQQRLSCCTLETCLSSEQFWKADTSFVVFSWQSCVVLFPHLMNHCHDLTVKMVCSFESEGRDHAGRFMSLQTKKRQIYWKLVSVKHVWFVDLLRSTLFNLKIFIHISFNLRLIRCSDPLNTLCGRSTYFILDPQLFRACKCWLSPKVQNCSHQPL